MVARLPRQRYARHTCVCAAHWHARRYLTAARAKQLSLSLWLTARVERKTVLQFRTLKGCGVNWSSFRPFGAPICSNWSRLERGATASRLFTLIHKLLIMLKLLRCDRRLFQLLNGAR